MAYFVLQTCGLDHVEEGYEIVEIKDDAVRVCGSEEEYTRQYYEKLGYCFYPLTLSVVYI